MRKIVFLILLSILLLKVSAFAQEADTSWKTKIEASLGFSQTTFTNWAAGGDNSLALNGMLNVFKNYAKGKVSWNNYLGLAYGINIQQTAPKVRKTNDKINLLTKGGIYAWKNWDYAGLFEFRSQFDKGFDYPNDSVYISRFLAPGYFQLSLGMNYKPTDYFAVFISPIGARLTLVSDSKLRLRTDASGNLIGAFGVIGDKSTLWQVGGSLNVVFKKDIAKNVNLFSKLDLFSDYLNKPQCIVVGWENNILMKVNKYLSMNLSTMLIADNNIPYIDKAGDAHGARAQFRETFSIGFAYTLVPKKSEKRK
jgi:hypothetical protein